MFQDPLCLPPGLECYKSVPMRSDECLPPCKGVYADAKRVEGVTEKANMEMFKPVLDTYKNYKSGFINTTEGE